MDALVAFAPTDLETAGAAPAATDSAVEYARSALSPASQRAYAADWRDFAAYCARVGAAARPADPTTIANYLAEQADAGVKLSTVKRRVAAIAAAHRALGLELSPTRHPAVQVVMRGIIRRLGRKQVKKAPVTPDLLRRLVALAGDDREGLLARAVLLLGFAGAFRRSELVSLDVTDLEPHPQGLVATLRRSKTDQEGEGRAVPIPFGENPETCPVRALRAWLAAAGITSGAVFRGAAGARLRDREVAELVKRYVAKAGLDPAAFSGHSLRAGFVTAAALTGAQAWSISITTGHRDPRTLQGYIRRATVFDGCAATKVGL